MSKKDYEKVAAMLRRLYMDTEDKTETGYRAGYLDALNEVRAELCAIFKADNPRFDTGRFMDAVIPEAQQMEG